MKFDIGELLIAFVNTFTCGCSRAVVADTCLERNSHLRGLSADIALRVRMRLYVVGLVFLYLCLVYLPTSSVTKIRVAVYTVASLLGFTWG